MSVRDELIERVMESIDVMDWHVTEEVWKRVRVEATVFVDAHRDEEFEALYNEMSRLVGVGPYSMGIMSVLNQAIDNIKEYRDE